MYFPLGWPKLINAGAADSTIIGISCDRVKILFTVLYENSICVWYSKPITPITFHKRSQKCLTENGKNLFVEWKPDSSKLVVATEGGALIIYEVQIDDDQNGKGLYTQNESPLGYLRRDSAELFIKETIPNLKLNMSITVKLYTKITCISCVTVFQMMVATNKLNVLRINWDGNEERDYSLDLRRIPFSINQQVRYAVPILENDAYIVSMDYSPLLAGFSIVLNDGRAGFLTSSNLKFDPNQVNGIWAPNIEDGTCTAINHKHRLIAFGRKNCHANVYIIDDLTGGLELSHAMILSSKDFPGSPGYVREMRWTPDGCAMVLSWSTGGISLWSTYGKMMMCSLAWDYGLKVDLNKHNPLNIISMDWSTEGYQLLMVQQQITTAPPKPTDPDKGEILFNESEEQSQEPTTQRTTSAIQLDFIKSVLTVNPSMSANPFLLLQGDDKLFLNRGDALQKMYANYANMEKSKTFLDDYYSFGNESSKKTITSINTLSESKHWIIITLPIPYAASNWPIRFSAIDFTGNNIAVAGRTGMALYSLVTRKWKLFGNETQEKDFVVTGALLWWNDFIILGSYSLIDLSDEIRIYPRDSKLDNRYAKIIKIASPVMLMNIYKNQLIIFTSDGHVSIFSIIQNASDTIELIKLKMYDIKNLCVHPACVVSIALANLKNDNLPKANQNPPHSDTLLLNVSGKIFMLQYENVGVENQQLASTCLASSVECFWLSNSQKIHLRDSLWLFCGRLGMRVWLPVFPRENGGRSHRHTFMSKRIMLSFVLKIYPLVILFEEAIILGAENDTILYTNDLGLHFSLPYSTLERSTQVYLHQILRQLIRRNLGYNAWEIARTCTNLPYFPHALELLLHEVLEEEATSKEPIPDALLPSVLEFIQEFPVYLQTVVQCARKTEIALWPYLFSMAGKPKDLFQQCITQNQLEIAASYLIILQNLEPSSVSRQYATMLLDTALEQKKWDLAKDLVRFLRAIDPNDVESPRNSFVLGSKFGLAAVQSSVHPNAEDLSLILGNNITRGRSFSTTQMPPQKQSSTENPATKDKIVVSTVNVNPYKRRISQTTKEKSRINEDFFIEDILQRHANKLLQLRKLEDLGFMAAKLDFHLVGWLSREKDKSAKIDDFVLTLKQLHEQLEWPKPNIEKLQTLMQDLPNGTTVGTQSVATSNVESSGYKSFATSNDAENFESYYQNTYQKQAEGSITSKYKNKHDLMFPLDMEANLLPKMDSISVASEQISLVWDEDQQRSYSFEIDEQRYHSAMEDQKKRDIRNKLATQKMEIKLRYLLQLFTEGDCLEFSLLLSILLLDKASVSRITNKAIRSNSLIVCRKIRNGLKDVTRWSLYECLGYQSFMLSLRGQITMLDNFVIQEESISPMIATLPTLPVNTEVNADVITEISADLEAALKLQVEPKLNISSNNANTSSSSIEKNKAERKLSGGEDRRSINSLQSESRATKSFNQTPEAKLEKTGIQSDEDNTDGSNRCIIM